MQNIPTKNTGDSYTAAEFNQSNDELKNQITDSGQALSGGDSFQISKANAVNAAGADYYDDSSHPANPNNYVLSKPGTSSLRSPPVYFEGMRIRFRPDQANDNVVSPDIIVAGVAVVPILKEDGITVINVGDLSPIRDAELRYDIGAGAFLLKAASPEATQSSKGIVYLRDQKSLISNNSVDPTNDIDFNSCRFTFDDGTGEVLASGYTKQLDAVFVAGNNQGGRIGTLADGTYNCFRIYNPSNGLSDEIMADSMTPSLPAGYTKKRYCGSILRESGAIVQFIQAGNYFFRRLLAFSGNYNPGATAVDVQLDVPINLQVIALFNTYAYISGTTFDSTRYFRIYSEAIETIPSPTTPTPSSTNLDTATKQEVAGGVNWEWKNATASEMLTNSDGELKVVAIANTDGSNIRFFTRGWIDYQLEN